MIKDISIVHLIVAWMLLNQLGCSRDSDPPQVRVSAKGAATMKTEFPWLTISSDPVLVERAIETAQQKHKEIFERFFANLGQSMFIGLEELEMLQQDRAKSVERLNSMLQSTKVSNESVGAAALLCRLYEPSGRSFAGQILQQGSSKQRQRLLEGLHAALYMESEKPKYREFLFADSVLVQSILAQLDDSDEKVVKDAIHCCGLLKVPGAQERFLKLIQRPSAPEKERLLYWLSQGELTEELFDFAVVAAVDVRPDHSTAGSIFEAFVNNATPPLRIRAQQRLLEMLKAYPDKAERGGYSGSRLGILRVLSESAQENDLAWIIDLVDTESGLFAEEPLVAYLRLSPKAGRAVLLEWFNDQKKRRWAIDVAGKSFAKSADPEIVRKLASFTEHASERELDAICSALSSIGGNQAQAVIEKHADRLDPASLANLRQQRENPPLKEIAAAVQSAELLSTNEIETALKQLPAETRERNPGLFELFCTADSATMFDVETGMIPCQHDRLVLAFAKASRGRFQPTAIQEIWHQKNKDDFEAAYTLQFVVNRKLYQAEIRNLGDWYDVERVVQMINIALQQEKIPERFIALAAEGQLALLVFAEPQRLMPVAKQFNMALSEDFEAAMHKGIEFENYVRESYNKESK